MEHFAPPEHRGPSDEQILAELLGQGPEGRPAAEPPIPQPGLGSRVGSFLFDPRETGAGEMNFLQALGLGFQDVGRGLQGQQLVLPQMAQRRGEQLQQQSQFQQELQAGFTRLEQQQGFEREMKQLDRDMDLLRETGVVSPALQEQMRTSGLSNDDILSLAKSKVEFNKITLAQKRYDLAFAEAKDKALKNPELRDFLLGIKQPPTAMQGAMLTWLGKLDPKVAARLAPMVLGGMNADQMLLAMGLEKGMSFKDLIALLKSGEADPELAALTKIVTALSAAQSGGIPLTEELTGLLTGAVQKLAERLKVKRPASKAETLREAQGEAGKALNVDDIIKKWQKANPGQMGRGAAQPRF